MSDSVFIDSNIFLYAFCDKSISKQITAKNIILNGAQTISIQVINEVSSNLIKKLHFNEVEVCCFINNCYDRYIVVNINKNVFNKASDLRSNNQFSYYDSVIVASALIAQCKILYSEDIKHGQRIDNLLEIINPFA